MTSLPPAPPLFSVNPGRRDRQASLVLSPDAERLLAQRSSAASSHRVGPEAAGVLVHVHVFYPELLAELLEPIAHHWPGALPELLITVAGDDGGERLRTCQEVFQQVFKSSLPACTWLEVSATIWAVVRAFRSATSMPRSWSVVRAATCAVASATTCSGTRAATCAVLSAWMPSVPNATTWAVDNAPTCAVDKARIWSEDRPAI